MTSKTWLLLTGVLAGLALAGLMWVASRWLRRLNLAWRFRRARRGETAADKLLAEMGYHIVGRQVRAPVSLTVDGELEVVEVHADLVVERNGQRWVVEVKTGQRATDPRYAPTRRQMLEYAVAFPGCEVLLADMEAQQFRIIRFPGLHLEPRQPPWRRVFPLVAAFAAGLLVASAAFALLRQ